MLTVTLTDAGRAMQDEALAVPGKIAGCIDLEPAEAQQLYSLLYKVLGE